MKIKLSKSVENKTITGNSPLMVMVGEMMAAYMRTHSPSWMAQSVYTVLILNIIVTIIIIIIIQIIIIIIIITVVKNRP